MRRTNSISHETTFSLTKTSLTQLLSIHIASFNFWRLDVDKIWSQFRYRVLNNFIGNWHFCEYRTITEFSFNFPISFAIFLPRFIGHVLYVCSYEHNLVQITKRVLPFSSLSVKEHTQQATLISEFIVVWSFAHAEIILIIHAVNLDSENSFRVHFMCSSAQVSFLQITLLFKQKARL